MPDVENGLFSRFYVLYYIASVLETQASEVYQQMPKVSLKGKRLTFFEKLPTQFDRKTFLSIAKELGISQRSTEGYITLFKEKLLDFDYNDFKKRGIA